MEDGRGGSGYLQAINQTDAPTVFIDPDKTTGSITLIAAKTYYFPIGGQPMSEDALVSVHAAWALALAGTWTIEVSNFPWKVGNGVSGGADSMALFHVLREIAPRLRLELHGAHFDHALREGSAAPRPENSRNPRAEARCRRERRRSAPPPAR